MVFEQCFCSIVFLCHYMGEIVACGCVCVCICVVDNIMRCVYVCVHEAHEHTSTRAHEHTSINLLNICHNIHLWCVCAMEEIKENAKRISLPLPSYRGVKWRHVSGPQAYPGQHCPHLFKRLGLLLGALLGLVLDVLLGLFLFFLLGLLLDILLGL